MSTKRKILFLTGTRADFGKLKSLINITDSHEEFEVHLFVTGMHMHYKYGYTVDEIERTGIKCIYKYINYTTESTMDLTLAKTIEGLSSYVQEEKPDLIVVHGDRGEALAGAIVGALNNIIVAHIEGGEVSGTIDELIRHAVTKMSHVHFVSNDRAQNRLVQMGELADNIFMIGSPDVDIMFSDSLPSLEEVKEYYEIPYERYAMLMFHPVTTEPHRIQHDAHTLIDVREAKGLNMGTFQKRIGYITQEPVIFDGTIFNNVTFWDEKTPDSLKRFHDALGQASILDFVLEQPDAENSRLGNNGINLSGGQKQRISIARELYKDIDFLFMDEATSALDSETERAIQENIDELKGQFTIIIIAHRLSTIKNADRVVMLRNGCIEHIGSYPDLIQQSATFKRMVELQEL